MSGLEPINIRVRMNNGNIVTKTVNMDPKLCGYIFNFSYGEKEFEAECGNEITFFGKQGLLKDGYLTEKEYKFIEDFEMADGKKGITPADFNSTNKKAPDGYKNIMNPSGSNSDYYVGIEKGDISLQIYDPQQ